jgi:hypothetical protein
MTRQFSSLLLAGLMNLDDQTWERETHSTQRLLLFQVSLRRARNWLKFNNVALVRLVGAAELFGCGKILGVDEEIIKTDSLHKVIKGILKLLPYQNERDCCRHTNQIPFYNRSEGWYSARWAGRSKMWQCHSYSR